MSNEDRFARLVAEFADDPEVTPPTAGRRRFGSDALTVGGTIFAMLVRDGLVVKLPAERVASLIEAGAGQPFYGGRPKPMRRWLEVADDADWSGIAREALDFVGQD